MEAVQPEARRRLRQALHVRVRLAPTLTLALLVGGALAWVIGRQIGTGAAKMLRAVRGIARGDLEQSVESKSKDAPAETAGAFSEIIAYLRETATAAEGIAAGDLTVDVERKSNRDVLGNAAATMTANLRGLVGNVADSAGYGRRHRSAARACGTRRGDDRPLSSQDRAAGRPALRVAPALLRRGRRSVRGAQLPA
jgi:methyl-accepting chemotaxis protein